MNEIDILGPFSLQDLLLDVTVNLFLMFLMVILTNFELPNRQNLLHYFFAENKNTDDVSFVPTFGIASFK